MATKASQIIDLLEPRVILFYRVLSVQSHTEAEFLIEEGHTYHFGKNWSARMDRGTQPNQQDHLHVMKNGRDISIINRDGSPSHKMGIEALPRKIRDQVRKLNIVHVEESSLQFIGTEELAAVIRLFYRTAGLA